MIFEKETSGAKPAFLAAWGGTAEEAAEKVFHLPTANLSG
jgi:hypothetical protein